MPVNIWQTIRGRGPVIFRDLETGIQRLDERGSAEGDKLLYLKKRWRDYCDIYIQICCLTDMM